MLGIIFFYRAEINDIFTGQNYLHFCGQESFALTLALQKLT